MCTIEIKLKKTLMLPPTTINHHTLFLRSKYIQFTMPKLYTHQCAVETAKLLTLFFVQCTLLLHTTFIYAFMINVITKQKPNPLYSPLINKYDFFFFSSIIPPLFLFTFIIWLPRAFTAYICCMSCFVCTRILWGSVDIKPVAVTLYISSVCLYTIPLSLAHQN